ncbi:MAG: nuclear transport factor 2 family protein, partial [Flammeovirgaceae bacterium]|nr:nuclear transport factor 2 family protein [Flammeovirgaceae bacterium]
MSEEENLIHTFYNAFQKNDYATMQSCYHKEATFSDPAFQNLNSKEVKSMWQMLITSARDLRIEFSDVRFDGRFGYCYWQAYYTFSRTGRFVHNRIHA